MCWDAAMSAKTMRVQEVPCCHGFFWLRTGMSFGDLLQSKNLPKNFERKLASLPNIDTIFFLIPCWSDETTKLLDVFFVKDHFSCYQSTSVFRKIDRAWYRCMLSLGQFNY
jgi:hypothetical protein